MRFNIEIEPVVAECAPELKVLVIEGDVVNSPTSEELAKEVDAAAKEIHDTYAMGEINKRPAILANRKAYKALGKDPNRYRPSSEALCRRAVKESGLYKISALVDLINILSMKTGYSIGGFDADKIQGDTLRLGRGREGEEFEGIGRGPLNIDGLPVYRDAAGGIGTPTSDHERTKISLDTTHLLMTINIYGEEISPEDTLSLATDLLTRHASATNLRHRIVE